MKNQHAVFFYPIQYSDEIEQITYAIAIFFG